MTKQEIYDQVVRLTGELKETGIPEKIAFAMSQDDAETINTILKAFPVFYSGLYTEIVSFGNAFNETIGDSEERNTKFENLVFNHGALIFQIAGTGIIKEIVDADSSGNNEKILELIKKFNKNYPKLFEDIITYQREVDTFYNAEKTGKEGVIFDLVQDDEEGMYVYNPYKIDALSFYILTVLARVRLSNFFYYDEDSEFEAAATEYFEEALIDITNRPFVEFVLCYDIYDWIGEDKYEYPTIGEILCAAYLDEFEKSEQADEEE